jgi:uncharacterized protein YciI
MRAGGPLRSCMLVFSRRNRATDPVRSGKILRYKRPLTDVDKHVEAHREWLRKNCAVGTFLISGRQRSGAGGFILASAIERAQLDAILAGDPFGQNDVADYEVIEVAPSMADERLSFLIEK